MNYIKEAENVLEHYRDLEYSLKLIEKRIVKLKYSGAPKDISAVNLEEMWVKPSPKHDETINVLCELKRLVEERHEIIQELDEVDKVLEDISQDDGCLDYGRVLKMWYIDEMPKEKIAVSLFYECKQSIYNIHKKAIRKFTIRWFGVSALRAI